MTGEGDLEAEMLNLMTASPTILWHYLIILPALRSLSQSSNFLGKWLLIAKRPLFWSYGIGESSIFDDWNPEISKATWVASCLREHCLLLVVLSLSNLRQYTSSVLCKPKLLFSYTTGQIHQNVKNVANLLLMDDASYCPCIPVESTSVDSLSIIISQRGCKIRLWNISILPPVRTSIRAVKLMKSLQIPCLWGPHII